MTAETGAKKIFIYIPLNAPQLIHCIESRRKIYYHAPDSRFIFISANLVSPRQLGYRSYNLCYSRFNYISHAEDRENSPVFFKHLTKITRCFLSFPSRFFSPFCSFIFHPPPRTSNAGVTFSARCRRNIKGRSTFVKLPFENRRALA